VPKLKISLPRPADAAALSADPNARPPPSVPLVKKRRRPPKLILIGGAVAAVLALGAAYFFLFASAPPPPVVAARPPPKPAAPSVAAGQPPAKAATAAKAPVVSLPGKMVEKAQVTVANRDAALDTTDGLLDKRPPAAPANPAGTSPKPAPPPPPNMTVASTALAPGISATNSDVVATPNASPAFRTWAANAKITGLGVRDGVARAIINGRTVRTGQIVDDPLGIVFFSLDAVNGIIVFKDKTGVTVERKYY
jgi:hypothetical protein